MKKVAILTQPLGRNYGGLLQAYALQTYLRRLGCDVEIIDRRNAGFKSYPVKEKLLAIIKIFFGRYRWLPTMVRSKFELRNLTDFRDARLSMSRTISNENEIREYFVDKNFNVVVVGSDQVWRPCYSPSILNFYLDFLDDIDSKAKRVSYAASFGVDIWEYPQDVGNECAKLVRRFDAVSVRESSAVDLCSAHFSISANWVVDPTMLLDVKDYEALIGDSSADSNNAVLTYILDPSEEKNSVVEKVIDVLSCEIVTVTTNLKGKSLKTPNSYDINYPRVEDWLRLISESRYVVTDSFHGVVFSILFNKPFLAIGNQARGLARFDSLLSQFDLGRRLVNSRSQITPDFLLETIDWDSVNKKRKILAEQGRVFLKANIFS